MIAVLLIAVAGFNALASRINVPYPIVLVLGGLVIGLLPGMPEVELDPDLVLVLFLPPLLYSAAFCCLRCCRRCRSAHARAAVLGLLPAATSDPSVSVRSRRRT